MLAWWKRRSKAWRIVVVGGFIVAVFLGITNYNEAVRQAERAKRFAADGVTTTAVPLSASGKSDRWGPISSSDYHVEYAFLDADGHRWDGASELTESEFKALLDPARENTIRKDATLDIIYSESDPKENGLKRLYEKPRGEPSLVESLIISLTTVAIFILIAAGLYRWVYGSRKAAKS